MNTYDPKDVDRGLALLALVRRNALAFGGEFRLKVSSREEAGTVPILYTKGAAPGSTRAWTGGSPFEMLNEMLDKEAIAMRENEERLKDEVPFS